VCKKPVPFVVAFFGVLACALVQRGISQPPSHAPKPDSPFLPPVRSVEVPSPFAITKEGPKKLVNIWTMQMEQVEGRSIVRATIGKKHEIRIECDVMDYQTQKGVFVSQGKVELSGVSVQCRCDRLTINLNDDRLVLEGKAEIRTFKERKYEKEEELGNPERILLELNGEQLSLRWPDLLIKAESRKIPVPSPDAKTFEKK
jgi:hypothetical protein